MIMRRREFSPNVRSAALLRAQLRCEQCGSKCELQLHHRGHPQDNSLWNCIVWCHACHLAEHKRGRRIRNGHPPRLWHGLF
jgi:hypothetical protein